MVTRKPRRLKVYQAQIGFYDTIVSAPNQAGALRAWGTHQNLFADGAARETGDPQATEAALAHPATPLRRAVGTTDPFSLDPAPPSLPDGPAPAHKPVSAPRAAIPKPAPRPKPADRSALSLAEAAIRALDEQRKRQQAEFRVRRAALDDEEGDAARAYRAARTEAEAAVKRERQAYAMAGGRTPPA